MQSCAAICWRWKQTFSHFAKPKRLKHGQTTDRLRAVHTTRTLANGVVTWLAPLRIRFDTTKENCSERFRYAILLQGLKSALLCLNGLLWIDRMFNLRQSLLISEKCEQTLANKLVISNFNDTLQKNESH